MAVVGGGGKRLLCAIEAEPAPFLEHGCHGVEEAHVMFGQIVAVQDRAVVIVDELAMPAVGFEHRLKSRLVVRACLIELQRDAKKLLLDKWRRRGTVHRVRVRGDRFNCWPIHAPCVIRWRSRLAWVYAWSMAR